MISFPFPNLKVKILHKVLKESFLRRVKKIELHRLNTYDALI